MGLTNGLYEVVVSYGANCETQTLQIQVGPANSLEDQLSAGILSFDLFPNPANGFFMIEMELSPGLRGPLVWELNDLQGRHVEAGFLSKDQLIRERIDLGGISPGVYFFTLETEQGRFSQKVIIY